jgi:hypothetical protein
LHTVAAEKNAREELAARPAEKKKLKNARTRPQEPRKRWNAKHLVLCGRPQKKKRKKTTMICT